MRVLVKRTGAFGDVLLTTPVVKRLRLELGDAAVIDMETQHPNAYKENPYVSSVGPKFEDANYDRVIDLNMVVERALYKKYGVVAYFEAAFGDTEGDKQPYLRRPPVPEGLSDNWDKTICIYPAQTWPSRTLPLHWWHRMVYLLQDEGFHVIVVGTFQDHTIDIDGVVDTRSRFHPQEQAAIIGASRVFLGSDSGLLCIAYATNVPIVTLLTITGVGTARPYRQREWGYRWTGLEADIPCVGCFTRITEPATFLNCPRGDNACVNTFDHNRVLKAVLEAAAFT